MSFFRKKRFRIILAVIAVVFALYWLLVNLLVSAALVPSFMRRLESFERITKKSYAEQVYTADLTSNSSVIWNLTNSWVRLAEKEKCEIVSEDGFSLKAMLFPANGAAPDASDANASTASDAIASTDPDATASTAPDADSGSGSGQTGSGNGQTLRGSKWAVLLHGYTGSKEAMYPIAFWSHRQGYHVLVPDLRCQGESDGDFIGMGWTDRRDVMQWINEVILARDPDAQVVLHGLSMGASCAVMVAGDPDAPACIRAVIADSAFTDAYSMFRYKIGDWFHLPAFPIVDSAVVALKLRGGYNLRDASALNAIRNCSVPVLLIHGSRDRFIPSSMAYDLRRAAGPDCDCDVMLVKGAGHTQAYEKDPTGYFERVRDLLDRTTN